MKSLYRPEIDGLRAIAVLGVLLFHLKVGLFSGGFLGVDVFFVISGYLITRNILNDAKSAKFTFSDFYIRRARRILPALIFTVAATFVCGLLWLPPELMRSLAKDSTHALLSIANIQYWREAKEYFATASDQLPLLHTWSLSLEEQFYLVWPMFLLAALRWNRIAWAIALAGVISFCFAVFWNAADPQAVFFLMPFRIFEFAIGAAAIFVEDRFRPKPNTAVALSVAGLLAVAASFTLFDEHSSFPVIAMLSSLGAASVIVGGAQPVSVVLLMNRPALMIGKASYSLYLCHWPIIFFARVIFGEAFQTWQGSSISLAVMMLCALGMRRYIEQPFRQASTLSNNRTTAIRFVSLIVVLVALTHSTFMASGLPWRITGEQQERAKLLDFGWSTCVQVKENLCAFGELGAPLKIEMIGDSFSYQYADGLGDLLKRKNAKGEASFFYACPMLDGIRLKHDNPKSDRCQKTATLALSKLKENSIPVIIGQDWKSYKNESVTFDGNVNDADGPYSRIKMALDRTISSLGAGRQILIIGAQIEASQCSFDYARLLPAPLPHAPPVDCKAKPRVQALAEEIDINAMLRQVQAKYPKQVRLLLPVDVWCSETECPAVRDGIWLYRDAGHFSSAGSRYMAERAQKIFHAFLDGK